MPAYLIAQREGPVRDEAAMAEYQRMNRENQGEFKLKPLAVYGATDALEGDAPDGTIIIEFPSVEEARAWYNSPAYQAAIPFRQKAADYRIFIVEGL